MGLSCWNWGRDLHHYEAVRQYIKPSHWPWADWSAFVSVKMSYNHRPPQIAPPLPFPRTQRYLALQTRKLIFDRSVLFARLCWYKRDLNARKPTKCILKGRWLERTETNLIHFKWGGVWIVTSFSILLWRRLQIYSPNLDAFLDLPKTSMIPLQEKKSACR